MFRSLSCCVDISLSTRFRQSGGRRINGSSLLRNGRFSTFVGARVNDSLGRTLPNTNFRTRPVCAGKGLGARSDRLHTLAVRVMEQSKGHLDCGLPP